MTGRRSVEDARTTRDSIMRAAAGVASTEGLSGITIGRLATELDMSKSGVIGQFGTKEDLQLATVDLIFGTFRERVWDPVQHVEAGLPRLLAICESWARYAEDPGFTGGCCVAQISFEFDSRTGRVHDEVARGVRRWRGVLVAEIKTAVAAGDLPPDTNAAQVAFSLEALATGMNPARLLHGDEQAGDWALSAMRSVLRVPTTA